MVYASVESSNTILGVKVWATNEKDTDICRWTNFNSHIMTKIGEKYVSGIPPNSVALFVELGDFANGLTGIVTSSTYPVNKNYPLLNIPPDNVGNFTVKVDTLNVNLSWITPKSEDFAGVTILRSESRYSISPTNGILIYDGTNTNFIDIVGGNSTYYYSAFSYDALGNYSAGAFTKVEVAVPEPILLLSYFAFFIFVKLFK